MEIQNAICKLLRIPVHTDANRSAKLPDVGSIGFNSDHQRIEVQGAGTVREYREVRGYVGDVIDIGSNTSAEQNVLPPLFEEGKLRAGSLIEIEVFGESTNGTTGSKQVFFELNAQSSGDTAIIQLPIIDSGVVERFCAKFRFKILSNGDIRTTGVGNVFGQRGVYNNFDLAFGLDLSQAVPFELKARMNTIDAAFSLNKLKAFARLTV